MAKRSKKSGTPKFRDLQYRQIISGSLPEAEKLLKELGVMTSPVESLPYSLRMSSQMALARQGIDSSSRFVVPDLSHLKERERIVAYYARPDVQQEMYRYAQGRLVTVLRNFNPMFSALQKPSDVLPLMFHYLKGANKPSMHGTILRRTESGKKVCDFVFEPDFKKNWAVAFGAARPIVQLFMSMGLPFFVKFSGSTSPHIIVPGEALATASEKDMKSHEFREAVYTYVRNRMHNPGLLDGANWQPDHFLRLAYSIHELGGRVSMPIRPEEFDSFNPDRARIENVVVIENWWHIPEDAAERGREFVARVLENYPGLVQGIGRQKIKSKWEPPEVPRKLRQIFGGGWYAKVLENGRQLLSPGSAPVFVQGKGAPAAEMTKALDMLKRWKSSGMKIDLKAAAEVFKVDIVELQHRWGLQNEDDHNAVKGILAVDVEPSYHYEYYYRREVREAFFHYAAGRCFRIPGAKAHFRLQEPSDIPALAAFFASSNPGWQGFECTRGYYDPLDNQITACDIGIEIDFSRSDCVSAVELVQVLMVVLQKYGVFCFAKFNGNERLEIVIPAEALPDQVDGQATALQMHQISAGLNRAFRGMPEVKGNDCLLVIQPYGYTRPAYSVNQETGLVCVVLTLEDLQDFSAENTEPSGVSVNAPWFHVPADAALQAQRFLKYALSPKWHPTAD